ncbi:hypothetical protein CU098_002491 [Rhizopus stolonifer]|uniref:Uncharacterized protein n=1 Tax=Rhizopus stolonifer TaxID=4846 RepID=A0A367KKQ2_RHIST|nr:hypothetical protein CU098_002491 [Rhizopus stolonifer]
MSDPLTSSSDDDLGFDNRTTTVDFQERLLDAQTQQSNTKDTTIRFDDLFQSQDPKDLRKQLDDLKSEIEQVENQVEEMEAKLARSKQRRDREAGITNMTPEQRAAYYEEEQKRIAAKRKKIEAAKAKSDIEERIQEVLNSSEDESDHEIRTGKRGRPRKIDNTNKEPEEEEDMDEEEYRKPNWDTVYEYMLLLSDAAEEPDTLIGSSILEVNEELKQKAFQHQEASIIVLRQTDYSSIKFTSAKNTLEFDTKDGDIRHCQLTGSLYDQAFSVSFDVIEPDMMIANLDFDVGFEMQLDVGSVLQQIKEENNIMGFFRLLAHYKELDHQRQLVFERLNKHFEDSMINIEVLSNSKLQFEGSL